jgi:hypothetical protein
MQGSAKSTDTRTNTAGLYIESAPVPLPISFYFRKRVGLGPLALNFSKSGIGISAGGRGLRAGLSSHRGVYTSAGLPGSGLRFVKYYRAITNASEPDSARG